MNSLFIGDEARRGLVLSPTAGSSGMFVRLEAAEQDCEDAFGIDILLLAGVS